MNWIDEFDNSSNSQDPELQYLASPTNTNEPRTNGEIGARTGGGTDLNSVTGISSNLSSDLNRSLNPELGERPEVNIQRVDFNPSGLRRLVCSNERIVMALENSHIIRLNLANPSQLFDTEITKRPQEKIHKLFLDYSGTHLIISLESGENYYLHAESQKPRHLRGLKNIVIDSVSWQKEGVTSSSTGTLLLGTHHGQVWEVSISETKVKTTKVFAFPSSSSLSSSSSSIDPSIPSSSSSSSSSTATDSSSPPPPITGIAYEKFPPTPNQPDKYFVFLATPSRLYQFIGGPTFESLFTTSLQSKPSFQEIRGGVRFSSLITYSNYPSQLAKSFAWLTGSGIYTGDLVFGSQNPGDSVTSNTRLIPYPKSGDDDGLGSSGPAAPNPASRSSNATTSAASKSKLGTPSSNNRRRAGAPNTKDIPISIQMTEWHFICLFKDRLQIINAMDESLVYEEKVGRGISALSGSMRGLARDPSKQSLWLYSDTGVYAILLTKEDSRIWSIFLKRSQYETALKYAKASRQRDIIYNAQANDLLAKGKYELAAKFYANTGRSFEEIALQFVSGGKREALKAYLLARLKKFTKREGAQRTAIATWLVEIYLDKVTQVSADPTKAETLTEEFHKFLSDFKSDLNPSTTFQLISSHGRMQDLLFYASLIKDFDRVIGHYLLTHQPAKALEVLRVQSIHATNLFYKYSPLLITKLPKQLIAAWMRNDKLSPRLLIPSLMKYSPPPGTPHTENVAIRYLQHVVKNLDNSDPAIHNYLFSLYVSQATEPALLDFIEFSMCPPQKPVFDLRYGLRLCLKSGKKACCVRLYREMGLFEEALDLALEIDLALAKELAAGTDDEALKKKLWLQIARHSITQGEGNIVQAMEILKQSECLKIEDVLPHFPDFVLIDYFKDEICASLEEYNNHIEKLKDEMDKATLSADQIRLDIHQISSRYGFVGNEQVCDKCSQPVLTRPFYLFPCQHVFHADCLAMEVAIGVNAYTRQRIKLLQQTMNEKRRGGTGLASSSGGVLTPSGKRGDDGIGTGGHTTPSQTLSNVPTPSNPSSAIDLARSELFGSGGGGGSSSTPTAASSTLKDMRDKALDMVKLSSTPPTLSNFLGSVVGSATGSSNTHPSSSTTTVSSPTGTASTPYTSNQQLHTLTLEQLKAELDAIISSECILCGDMLIRTIDKPFIGQGDEEEKLSWEL